jgi:isopenicillin-N N-acyltransferase-like protein
LTSLREICYGHIKEDEKMTTDRRTFIKSIGILGLAGAMSFGENPSLPFPELVASGNPGDLGLAHGKAFPGQIRYNLEFYKKWLSGSGQVSIDHLFELTRGFISVINSHCPSFLEEMDGIARGAGLKLIEIVMINARTDLYAMVEREIAAKKIPACTSLAMVGKKGAHQYLALGQNWDWDTLMMKSPVVLRLRPREGPELVTLTEAGMLAKIGFNEHRLGVCLNFLSHQTDGKENSFGIPIHCLLRVALNSESIHKAIKKITSFPRCASANFLMAQYREGKPLIRDLELTPEKMATLEPEGNHLVHTNHFLDPSLAKGCTSGRGPSTMNRYRRARRIAAQLEHSEPDPVKRMKRVLVSRTDLPYPISRKGNPDPTSTTVAGIIMDLTGNRMVLTAGPPHENPWVIRPGVGKRSK